jgi:hypothetical protein
MSGGVIWELQAGRRPFQMISHPLAMEHGISKEQKAAIELALATRPPKAIILDGFTEKTYIQQVPRLRELLHRYRLVTATGPPGLPVRLYQLNDEPVLEKTYSIKVPTVESQRQPAVEALREAE